MIRATFDPSAWAFMSVEAKTTAPGGFALALSPKLPELAPLHAEGWQVQDHLYMGNGYVRVTLRRGRDWKPTPAAAPVMDWAPLEAAKAAREDEATTHYEGGSLTDEQIAAYHRQAGQRDAAADPRGTYISRKAEEDVAMAAHMTAHQARLRAVKDPIAYREEWFKGWRPAAGPIDDSAARRAWGIAP